MNEYQIALIFSACIAALWLCAYVLSWVGQWAWAWVDDSKTGENNWLVERFTKRTKVEVEWIYPVYNAIGEDDLKRHREAGEVFGYAKNKKHDHASVHGIKHSADYIHGHEKVRLEAELVYGYMLKATLASTASPMLLLVSFKLYPIAIALATIYGTAHLARYARRHKKVFDEHVKDKKAHD